MSSITEILKLKGDQEVFIPEGDWIAVEGGGVYKDHEYLIVLNKVGYRCGYVAIPPEHPFSNTPEEERSFMGGRKYKHYDYDSLDIDAHGGLTFMAPNHGLKDLLTIPCNDMWIGFDCGHCYDSPDVKAFEKYFGKQARESQQSFFSAIGSESYDCTIKNYDYAESECHSIIEQLIQKAA
jgi:hypothetical protein